jgi:hypothetical protein
VPPLLATAPPQAPPNTPPPPVVLIEDKASGTQLITEGCHGVTRNQPTGDKTMRLHAQTAVIENGFVHIPETAPWLAEYLHEMTVFPNAKHDDQADSTAQFLDWFKRPFPGQGIYEYYRRRPRARGAAQATTRQDSMGGRLHGMASRAGESRLNCGGRSGAPTDRRQLS